MPKIDWSPPDVIDPDAVIQEAPDSIVWRAPFESCERAVIKLYRRRSAFSALRGRISGFRVAREYRNLAELDARAIPTSVPLGWTTGRSPIHGRYEVLVTREILGARSLKDLIGDGQSIDWDLGPLFEMIRRMHERGFLHGWLHLGNVMTAGGSGTRENFLIDAPTAVIFPGSIVGTPMALYELAKVSELLVRSAGLPAESLPLAAYGLADGERSEFLRDLKKYSRSKTRRRQVWVDTRMRWLAAWAHETIRGGRSRS